jgi:hypothetical protein
MLRDHVRSGNGNADPLAVQLILKTKAGLPPVEADDKP